MLHDKLLAENFLHRTQKERSLSPHDSTNKMDLYAAYRYQVANQLRREENEVLDLSRRCDSVETPPRKTPSPPYQNSATNFSPRFETSSPKSATVLAANLQKLYAQHSAVSSTATIPNFGNQQTTNLSLNRNQEIQMNYPIYCPATIKSEREISPTPPLSLISQSPQQHLSLNNQHPSSQFTSKMSNAFPQNYHHHQANNLLQSINLIKAASFPPQTVLTNLPHTSPKLAGKAEYDDRMSDISSIPESPTSSGQINQSNSVPKLLNSAKVSTPSISETPTANGVNVKATRPFKAFPRDPLVIAANFAATDILYDNPRVERYTEYRKRVLEQIRSANGGERTVTNPKMRRTNNRLTSATRSDGSNSDGQLNNSESEDRTGGESDNDSTAPTTTGSDGNLLETDKNINNNNQMYNQNGGHGVKDAAYFERRRKNNAAAKKSRDRRRIKEDEIAIRAAYLERQNIELLCQLDALKAQIANLTKC